MRVQLHPSFLRGAASVLSWFVAVCAVSYFQQGYREHIWWTLGYIVSLLILGAIVASFVCLMDVPSHLEFTDTHLIIRHPFRRLKNAAWDDLEYYRWEGPGLTFVLKFRTVGTISFLPQALPKREWQLFKRFLYTTFPDRKVSGLIPRFYRWLRKKKKT
jgi:hypothetical protein